MFTTNWRPSARRTKPKPEEHLSSASTRVRKIKREEKSRWNKATFTHVSKRMKVLLLQFPFYRAHSWSIIFTCTAKHNRSTSSLGSWMNYTGWNKIKKNSSYSLLWCWEELVHDVANEIHRSNKTINFVVVLCVPCVLFARESVQTDGEWWITSWLTGEFFASNAEAI